MSDVITLAIVAGVQVLLLTIVQSTIAARKERTEAERKRVEREEDYARQDLVAERVALAAKQAADAAQLLVKAQHETIARTDEVAKVAAASDALIQAQLKSIDTQGKKIHILVNSDMTAARTNERDQARLTLLALKRVQALSAKLGLSVTRDEVDAIKTAEERIVELDQILADRLAAQRAVDEEAAASALKEKNQ
jgi:hypothetical protein